MRTGSTDGTRFHGHGAPPAGGSYLILAAEGSEPDTGYIPEAPTENWHYARRFYKPRKEAVSLRLDADVLDRLRHKSERYQSEINRILRERPESEVGG
jgi:uncharacterized protein (DUF4415 family)